MAKHSRTEAQRAAMQRDEWKCMWHLVVLEQVRDATDGHHLFRPWQQYDKPEYIISLCTECHRNFRHYTGSVTDQMIIDRVMIPYVWGGNDLTPRLLPGQVGYIRDGLYTEKTRTFTQRQGRR